jgi:hypothetical protein
MAWARMHCQSGAVMFLLANDPENPPNPEKTTVLFYLYTDDLPALREHLLGQGVECPKIAYPNYLPSGEMMLRDPDGYGVIIAHWSEEEHTRWLEKIGRSSA